MRRHPLLDEARSAWRRQETETAVRAALAAHAAGDDDGLALACSIALRGYRADLLGAHRNEIAASPAGAPRDGVLAMLQVGHGDLDGAVARLVALADAAADPQRDPLEDEGMLLPLLLASLAAGCVVSASWVRARQCIDAARAVMAAASGIDGAPPPEHVPFDLLGLEAVVERHTGAGDAAHRALVETLAPLRLRNSLTSAHALALVSLGSVEHVSGRLGEAALNLARGIRLTPAWRPGVRLHGEVELALVRIRQGRWRDAAEGVRTTTARVGSIEHDWLEPPALAVHGLLLALRGDFDASRPVLERVALLCRHTPSFLAQMVLTHARIMAAISLSDWPALQRALDDATEPGYRHPYRVDEWRMLTLLAAWHLRSIDEFRSGVLAWAAESAADESAYCWAFVSILAEHDGRYAEATRAVDRALGLLSLDNDPLGRAWVRVVAGIHYSRFGAHGQPDPLRALVVYEDASAELTELGAGGLARRYDEAVAATTTAVVRVSPGEDPAARLTDQQRKVADAVGQGYTSGEIAGLLHLSKRTVDYHVANIMRRLGVSTRREIARVLGVRP
ncbi:LuxR C-terminal-related transcriptional regulator [Microbacterium sp. NM3R9]|uniref:LuxR C-terminal-related transcriptional regulator n=1 Tax=Microbacterium thalli TaxID=3027921 RepID=UPI0023659828|nr:LuxR C-terminal-related transcriptional regulator [Microbacterium thalli]MDN8548936.1 LuxR C-terminal-related transcriptional regulator [Microbacterium thalli]